MNKFGMKQERTQEKVVKSVRGNSRKEMVAGMVKRNDLKRNDLKRSGFKRTIAVTAMAAVMSGMLAGCGGAGAPSVDTQSAGDAHTSPVTSDMEPAAIGGGKGEATGGSRSQDSYANAIAEEGSYTDDGYVDGSTAAGDSGMQGQEGNAEEYDKVIEVGFAEVTDNPLSTFAADVDTASYANLRRMINSGYAPWDIPVGAVRTEEMVNYFSYNYKGPQHGEPFGVNAAIAPCPWNGEHLLLHLGLATEEIDFSEAGGTNIVLLIDVSGSMAARNKLPLLQESFGLLVDELGEKDTVSIVTYASGNQVVLDGVPGSKKKEIMDALNNLGAGGSTNGGQGLLMAYDIAEEHFIENGNNRVIIASDGDWNVGITSQQEMSELVQEKRESGIYLSVLGFGMSNYSDSRMQTLADDGNGNYAYIDTLAEAKKVLVEELGANMVTVAEDVKLQIEFNPAYVAEYRLLGYENRLLAAEDFEDDTKDAGDVGAGHSVTALYELVPADEEGKAVSGLRYQQSTLTDAAKESGEWLTLSVRYKDPGQDESQLLVYPIGYDRYTDAPGNDFRFAAAVAEFSLLLRNSDYKGDASYSHLMECLANVRLNDEYRQEFMKLAGTMAEFGDDGNGNEW
ncbi:MAG: VWA domain-containing protein [Lachnospiraceae bacterium]|nr:VWA domain-containing protein [Lachnospiraceae bacterium]